MRLTVRYVDGSVESFDTNALTTTSPLGRDNALTDLRVALDDGLWVEASWYRVPHAQGDDGGMSLAQRTAGCRIHVLSEQEVELVRSVELDGRVQWLRIGPDLCDVTRLFSSDSSISWVTDYRLALAVPEKNLYGVVAPDLSALLDTAKSVGKGSHTISVLEYRYEKK